ncbi:hypothetical protein DE146DRAFT_665369 [Phaeosphaeria sp. MPI-PUGE-AT-0046c]|nr:hypothetical protein DE146DRAFT_665369 [Phaeosphaeria sp. MPI-PUGE-AT-0046c]
MGYITIFVNPDMNAQYSMSVSGPIPAASAPDHAYRLCIAMSAISIWSTVPLTTRLLTTMKRRSGLYFYSILITSIGISVRQIGVLMVWFTPHCPWAIRRILIEVGSMAMVSGFSLVLYSRLNLIAMNYRIRRAVLAMMIFNGFVWHVAVIINNAGIRYLKERGHTDRVPGWEMVHIPIEKIKIVMFTTQEIVISLFYVRAAYQYLQGKFNTSKGKARSAMSLLLLIQVIIIASDVAICTLNLVGERQLKVIVHSFVYAIKLELEFVVLNQLIALSKMGLPGIPSRGCGAKGNQPDDADDGKVVLRVEEAEAAACKSALGSTRDLESCRHPRSSSILEFITTPESIDAFRAQ